MNKKKKDEWLIFEYSPLEEEIKIAFGEVFKFDKKEKCFYFNTNPEGTARHAPIDNLLIAEDFSSVSFDIACRKRAKKITVQSEMGKLFVDLFAKLHESNFSFPKSNFDRLRFWFLSDDIESVSFVKENENYYILDQIGIAKIEEEPYIIIQRPCYRRLKLSSVSVENGCIVMKTSESDEIFSYNLNFPDFIYEFIRKAMEVYNREILGN